MRPNSNPIYSGRGLTALQRMRLWYVALLLVGSVLVVRLFYLQVIKHDYYSKAALASQLKQYQIEPERGVIEAHNGDGLLPIVLNEKRYTLYADPKYVVDAEKSAVAIASVIGGSSGDYIKAIKTPDTRYVILAKKLTKQQKDKIDAARKAENEKLASKRGAVFAWKGIGTQETSVRTYPQGDLAAQVLGFVNDEGIGKYGIEQALNDQLKGTPGQLKAITDAAGVPLAANKDNVVKEPVAGKRIVLTINIAMQQQLEEILKKGLDSAKSKSGGAFIMDPNTGAILAMANYPTFNPGEFYKVDDPSVFTNGTVSAPLEVGSTMKPLTAAAALDLGVVSKNQSYYDPSHFKVDGFEITNIEEDGGAGTRTIADILQLSLNTGATWLLMQMGGGEINKQARDRWFDYMTNHYQFGKKTGIEQGYEAAGTIPDPNEGYGLNLQYANTSFGQGMTATPLQMGAALSSVINGGTYYKPHLVDGYADSKGSLQDAKPTIVRSNVVKRDVGQDIQEFMEYTFSKNHVLYGFPNFQGNYTIGGKTGTAQIANPSGGYFEDKFNGTFMGFVGGNAPQYVIVTRVDEPGIGGYAGSRAAAPIFSDLASMLINNFNITPKGQ